MVNNPHIVVTPEVKSLLDSLKLYSRETYCDVLERLLSKEVSE